MRVAIPYTNITKHTQSKLSKRASIAPKTVTE